MTKRLLLCPPHQFQYQCSQDPVLSNDFPDVNYQKRFHIEGKNLEHLKIRLTCINLATDNFLKTYKMSSWLYITYYRAQLDYYAKQNPSPVVIKRVSSGQDLYREKDFLTEIEVLTRFKHPNIVTLYGFCIEASEMILVLEDFSNGLLDDYLRNNKKRHVLTWEKRLKICIDVAHALNNLHSEKVIHRDICSCNIGLDENWGGKIVSFQSSVFLSTNQDGALYPNWIGKPFYIDPEYKLTNKLKRESDVYSFGVVLFEILCGRMANDPIYLGGSDKELAAMARRMFCAGTIEEMVDPLIKEEACENNFVLNRGPNKDSLKKFIKIAYRCVAETQDQRPTMKDVVKKIERALFLQKNNKDNPRIPLEDIKLATQNFQDDNCICEVESGKLYIGNLKEGNGVNTIVAKRMDKRSGQVEKQFLNELQILLEYKHKNIHSLVGYCDEQDEKIIVYEFTSKGTLHPYLNDASLTWRKRLNICIDVASALDYIHGGFGKQAKVIHGNINTANILLDRHWKPKLADFRISLICPINQKTEYVIDYACGTPDYIDPLHKELGFLTIESDIYSFGMVLFEMLCGRSTFEIHEHEGCYLPDFIKNRFKEGKHDDLVFEKIRSQIKPKSLITFVEIAYQCLQHEREKRPTAKEVFKQLKKASEFQKIESTMTKLNHLRISYNDIVKATNNFHDDNIIGHAEYGTTYKGQLLRFRRLMKIAAQRFDCRHGDRDLEFLREISVLSDLKHTNVVSLIGFCDEKDEKIIVTSYEANGSLGQYLNSVNLTWTQRLRICIGVGRALSYLHHVEERDYDFIHCNVSTDTILLDENWTGKLSGFEICIKCSSVDKGEVWLYEHNGTMGCMDPVIEKTGAVNYESDIYSFGVVLFQILCGRKSFIENGANMSLAQLARCHYENKTLHEIIHPDLVMSPDSVRIYSDAAYSCLNTDRADRPDMEYIVTDLEKALEYQLEYEYIGKKFKHLEIRLSAIKLATNNFSKTCIIATRSYATCYRAELKHCDQRNPSFVDIKRVTSEKKWYRQEHFVTEIEVLTRVKHPNIVTLHGFCVENSEMILVTDNVSNGFLSQYLKNREKRRLLTWEKRLKICIDVAHALDYLHSKMKGQLMIINRNINCYSIGLDENWGAKILSFEDSVFLPKNQDEACYFKSTGIPSYIDPEYKETNMLKRESDVYSFGVVLFEILCGTRANDPIYTMESDKELAEVARRMFCAGTIEEMIDPLIKEEASEGSLVLNRGPNKDSLHAFTKIAYQCVAETQDQRPPMKAVVKELERALFLQENKKRHENST